MKHVRPNILTQEGYFEYFYFLISNGYNHREAYEQIELEREQEYSVPPKYSSYESFRVGKSKYFNNK